MPVRSSGRALSATLPKRSTTSTLAVSTPSRATEGGTSMRTRSAGSSSGPTFARAPGRPPAAPRPARTRRGRGTSPRRAAGTAPRAVMTRARSMPPSASAAGTSRPLSGPTSSAPSAVSSTSARRCRADARIDDAEVHAERQVRHRPTRARSEPPRTLVGSMPCVTWMTRTAGAVRTMTPSMTPANSSRRPKSVTSVTTGATAMGGMMPHPSLHRRPTAPDDGRSPGAVVGR